MVKCNSLHKGPLCPNICLPTVFPLFTINCFWCVAINFSSQCWDNRWPNLLSFIFIVVRLSSCSCLFTKIFIHAKYWLQNLCRLLEVLFLARAGVIPRFPEVNLHRVHCARHSKELPNSRASRALKHRSNWNHATKDECKITLCFPFPNILFKRKPLMLHQIESSLWDKQQRKKPFSPS